MSKTQIKRLVRTASPEQLEEHIWALNVALMETIEWIQSNYPGVKIPDFVIDSNNEAMKAKYKQWRGGGK